MKRGEPNSIQVIELDVPPSLYPCENTKGSSFRILVEVIGILAGLLAWRFPITTIGQ